MKIDIKSTHLDLTPAIKEYIESKIGALDKFIKRFESKSEIKVFIEIARTTRHHHSGNVFYAEAIIPVGKKILRAEHSSEDIRLSIDRTRDKLQQEIKKYKEVKETSNRKKSARIIEKS